MNNVTYKYNRLIELMNLGASLRVVNTPFPPYIHEITEITKGDADSYWLYQPSFHGISPLGISLESCTSDQIEVQTLHGWLPIFSDFGDFFTHITTKIKHKNLDGALVIEKKLIPIVKILDSELVKPGHFFLMLDAKPGKNSKPEILSTDTSFQGTVLKSRPNTWKNEGTENAKQVHDIDIYWPNLTDKYDIANFHLDKYDEGYVFYDIILLK